MNPPPADESSRTSDNEDAGQDLDGSAKRGSPAGSDSVKGTPKQTDTSGLAIPLSLSQILETKELECASDSDDDAGVSILDYVSPAENADALIYSDTAELSKFSVKSSPSMISEPATFVNSNSGTFAEQDSDDSSSDGGVVISSFLEDEKYESTLPIEDTERFSHEDVNMPMDSPGSALPTPLESHEEIAEEIAPVKSSKVVHFQDEMNDSVDGAPTSPLVSGALRASALFSATFPHGYEIIKTSPDGLLCGLEAINKSARALYPGTGIPTVGALQTITKGDQYISQNALFATEEEQMNNTNYFSGDQLALMLKIWGSYSGANLQLGYITSGGVPQLVPVADGKNAKVIWIHNDDAEAELGILGHWSGIKAKAAPQTFKAEIYRTLHERQQQMYKVNESMLFGSILRYHKGVCPYSLLRIDCPYGTGCTLTPVCRRYGEGGFCPHLDCSNCHLRYSCVSFIEHGRCNRLHDQRHWEMYAHEGDGDRPGDREVDWRSREAHAALRETHRMMRYY